MTLEFALFIVLVLLQFLDYSSTTRILAAGGRELNPVVTWLFDRLGQEQALIFKGFVVLAVGGFLHSVLVLGLMDAVYVAVVGWNTYQIYKGSK